MNSIKLTSHSLIDFVKQEYQTETVYPPGKEIFRAFDCCDFDDVKVVIIGQDPYHGPGQATGLCFFCPRWDQNAAIIGKHFKELHNDLGKPIPKSGDLERWANARSFIT
jgi:uracil-DNA glycosylase